jgi:hypothetical protein
MDRITEARLLPGFGYLSSEQAAAVPPPIAAVSA